MITERQKHRHPKLRIAVIVHIVLFILVGFGFGEEYLRNAEIEHQISRMQAENAKIDADRLSSLKLINTLSSSYYVEGEARQSGMGKDGERLIIVENGTQSATSAAPAAAHSDVPNTLRWFEYFFDHSAFLELSSV